MTSTEELRKKLLELLISEMQNSQHAVVMDEGNAFVVSKDYKKLAEKVLDPAISLFQEYSDARVKEALNPKPKINKCRGCDGVFADDEVYYKGSTLWCKSCLDKLTTPAPSDSNSDKDKP